jgi:CDP-diglyceride synthetase
MNDFLSYFAEHAIGFADLNLGLQIGWGLLFANIVLATLRGGSVERLVLLAMCVSFYVSQYIYYSSDRNSVAISLLAVDAILVAILIPFALYSNRYWPMWFVSILLITLFVDLALLATNQLRTRRYWLISNASTDAVLATLLVGTLVEPKQRPWGWFVDASSALKRGLQRS